MIFFYRGKSDDGDKEEIEEKFKDQLGSVIVMEKPNVKWSDVAGLEDTKEVLKEAVIFPTNLSPGLPHCHILLLMLDDVLFRKFQVSILCCSLNELIFFVTLFYVL